MIVLSTGRKSFLWCVGTCGSNDYGCAFFEEVVVNGVVTLLSAPSFSFLLREITWVFNVTFFLTRETTAR